MAVNLATYIPDRKFVAGGIFGLAAWGILFGAQRLGVAVPNWIADALPLVIAKAVAYMTWPSAQDIIRRINGDLAAVAGYMPIPASVPAAAARAQVIAPSLPLDPATKEALAVIKATTPVLVPAAPPPGVPEPFKPGPPPSPHISS